LAAVRPSEQQPKSENSQGRGSSSSRSIRGLHGLFVLSFLVFFGAGIFVTFLHIVTSFGASDVTGNEVVKTEISSSPEEASAVK